MRRHRRFVLGFCEHDSAKKDRKSCCCARAVFGCEVHGQLATGLVRTRDRLALSCPHTFGCSFLQSTCKSNGDSMLSTPPPIANTKTTYRCPPAATALRDNAGWYRLLPRRGFLQGRHGAGVPVCRLPAGDTRQSPDLYHVRREDIKWCEKGRTTSTDGRRFTPLARTTSTLLSPSKAAFTRTQETNSPATTTAFRPRPLSPTAGLQGPRWPSFSLCSSAGGLPRCQEARAFFFFSFGTVCCTRTCYRAIFYRRSGPRFRVVFVLSAKNRHTRTSLLLRLTFPCQ